MGFVKFESLFTLLLFSKSKVKVKRGINALASMVAR
jgi:hypothetical protein